MTRPRLRSGLAPIVARVAALTVAITIAVAGAAAPGAGAQASPVTFALTDQSPWVAPGTAYFLRFDAANVPVGSVVALTVHDKLRSRTAFDASVDGSSLPPTRGRQAVPFESMPVDAASGDRELVAPSGSLDDGVYPVEVDLRSPSDELLAHFVTHVVVTPVTADGALTVGQPLNVAWVWPLAAEPGFVATDTPNLAALAALRPEGRLGRQARQLAANTDVPLTLAPSPETLDAWATFSSRAELAEGANAIRSTLGRNQVMTGPFVPLDMPAILRSGLDEVINPEMSRGAKTLEAFFNNTHLDPSAAFPGPLDEQSARVLQAASARQLVLEGSALTPVNEKYTPAHPYRMRTVSGDDTTAVTVVATDTNLEKFLTGDDPPALRAAHLLAGLSLVAGEQPSLPRGIAIANPATWNADDTFVARVLAGLRGNPLLKPTTVAGLLERVPVATVNGDPDGPPVYRQLAPVQPSVATVTARQYQRAVDDRNAVSALVGPADPLAVRADRALASSVAASWQTPEGRPIARSLLRSIGTSVEAYLAQIKVQPQSTITITSSRAEIPIGFQNTSDDDVTVHLALQSDRLLFPEGAERDVLLPARHNTTVRVAVETRGSGTSPVVMTVTANGLPIPGGEGRRISVRSSFVSGVGVFLTVGAIVFLAFWWGLDIHRRRKKRSRDHHPTYRLATSSGHPA